MTAPYSLKSTELVGSLNTLDGDIENDELLSNFIDYLARFKASDAKNKSSTEYNARIEEERRLLNEEKRAIYGDGEEVFQPRSGRVAHQWDSLYFHFKEKYGHGQLENPKDAYDWLGFVVFKDSNAMSYFTRGNQHRFNTIHDNYSVTLPLSGKGRREREKQRARNDDTRFNVNMLRERIIAHGAVLAFKDDNSRNKKNYKIWPSSIPDNTQIEFRPPQPPPSDDSEATTELFSTIAKFGVSLGAKAFKYVFSSFYNATPANVPVLVASETKKVLKQHRSHFVDKYAKAMPITDATTSLPLGTEEPLRRAYHTEYVLFHNEGMTLTEIQGYAKYLDAVPRAPTSTTTGSPKKAAKKPEKPAAIQDDDDDDSLLIDTPLEDLLKPRAATDPTAGDAKKKPMSSTPGELSLDEGDFDD